MQPTDIAIIMVVALIVFGPKRLPQVGNELGQAMRELRKITDEATAVSPIGKSLSFLFLAALLTVILLNATRVG